MISKRNLILAAIILPLLGACTDADFAHLGALGSSARVSCYSGGKLVADDFSTGKVSNAGQSDGYEFKSVTTHRLEQFSGSCVVDYGATPATDWKAVLPGGAQ